MSPDDGTGAVVPEFPRARDDVVFRELADEWVVFDPEVRRLHVLNLTAAVVWSHCTGTRAVDEIVRRVRDSFDEAPSPEKVRSDVRDALERFARARLLEDPGRSGAGP